MASYSTIDVPVMGSSVMTTVSNRSGQNFNDANGKNYELNLSSQGVTANNFAFGPDAVVVITFTNPTLGNGSNQEKLHGHFAHKDEIGPNSTVAKITVYQSVNDYNAGKVAYSYLPQNPINNNGMGGGNISGSEQGTGDLYVAFQSNVFGQSSSVVRESWYQGPIPTLGNEFFIMPSVNLYDEMVVNRRNVTVNRVTDYDYDGNGSITGDEKDNGYFSGGAIGRNFPPRGICFARGTMIETSRGPVAIERLKIGDLIQTKDHGLQKLRWSGMFRLSFLELARAPHLCPIVIKEGALGENRPASDLRVSPQHRILLRSTVAARMFGAEEILVTAKHLVNGESIYIDQDCDFVEYHHLLFERHEVIYANGAEAESLYTGPMALKMLSPISRAEIFKILPVLQQEDYQPEPARPLVQGRRLAKLTERHYANRKPLYAA